MSVEMTYGIFSGFTFKFLPSSDTAQEGAVALCS